MKAGMFTGQRFRGMVALGEAEKPKPRDGEVLVAVEVASVNAADYRSMRMKKAVFMATGLRKPADKQKDLES